MKNARDGERERAKPPAPSDVAQAKRVLREVGLGNFAQAPAELIEQNVAELMRDYREACTLCAHAVFKTAQDQLNEKVRRTATDVLIHLHALRGHAIPAAFKVPTKNLPELLNDLEDALFVTVELPSKAVGAGPELKVIEGGQNGSQN